MESKRGEARSLFVWTKSEDALRNGRFDPRAYRISRCSIIVEEETPIALSATNRKQRSVFLKIARVPQRTLSGTSRVTRYFTSRKPYALVCSEFNFVKDDKDQCVPVPGTTPRPDDDSCSNGEDYWYQRTAYRKIPYSSCENGDTRNLGTRHVCPGFKAHSALFWMFMILIPFGFTALVAYYYYRRKGMTRGYVFSDRFNHSPILPM